MIVSGKTAKVGQLCHRLILGPTAGQFLSCGHDFPTCPETGLHSVVSEDSLSPGGL